MHDRVSGLTVCCTLTVNMSYANERHQHCLIIRVSKWLQEFGVNSKLNGFPWRLLGFWKIYNMDDHRAGSAAPTRKSFWTVCGLDKPAWRPSHSWCVMCCANPALCNRGSPRMLNYKYGTRTLLFQLKTWLDWITICYEVLHLRWQQLSISRL